MKRAGNKLMAMPVVAVLIVSACSESTEPEPQTAIESNGPPSLGTTASLTVSGLSSGAYMATQYHVAHSANVSGAGIFAGGPWGCAQGRLKRALSLCVSGENVNIDELLANANALAENHNIDSPENLDGDRVLVFHGSEDALIGADLVAAVASWYEKIAPRVIVERRFDVPAAHGMATLAQGADCSAFAAPFINACDFDLAGITLQHLLGELNTPGDSQGELIRFNQAADSAAGLADTGYAYVPSQCRTSTECGLHVFFHGCGQSATQIGTTLVEQAGFNRWAASNDLVVLYPQTRPSDAEPQNPLACWDWWGYSGANYLAKDGTQMAAVHWLVEKLRDTAD